MKGKTMKENDRKSATRKGGTTLGLLIGLLLVASIALNVILVSGCDIFKIGGEKGGTPLPPPPSDDVYLREIASALGIEESPAKTPGDIAFDIKQHLDKQLTYKGKVLAAGAFEKASAAIRISEDRETFKAYHDFISKIAGKKIVVLE